MARIVAVYNTERRAADLVDMSYIRWFKISEALARRGHEVDIATAEYKWRFRQPVVTMGPALRRVPLSRVDWARYDVVKTLFHQGFRTLERFGGGSHPFIISKLGSVVGPEDMAGIYFYGRRRRALYETQQQINATSRYVAFVSAPAKELWVRCFGPRDTLLVVPGGVDRDLPPTGPDPFPAGEHPRCLFAGNLYRRATQREANRTLVAKLNALGARLRELDRNARLYVLGPGDARRLDRRAVSYLGVVSYVESWRYLRHADVGVLVAAGPFLHNNESSKLYHYLRAGVPVVSEAGFPNDSVLRDAQLGLIVRNGDLEAMATALLDTATRAWDTERAVRYILEHHTWDARAAAYDRLLRRHFPG
jgi:glycosyltransferase involved in cell wall biosynthesis